MPLSRVQLAVVTFTVLAVLAFVALLITGSQLVPMPVPGRPAQVLFLTGLTGLLAVLLAGTLRRWRWTFWLVVVAFGLGGLIRIPASALQLAGAIPPTGPAWYMTLQGAIGVIQVVIAAAMLRGWRRGGAWND
jgi:hypothetical protein